MAAVSNLFKNFEQAQDTLSQARDALEYVAGRRIAASEIKIRYIRNCTAMNFSRTYSKP